VSVDVSPRSSDGGSSRLRFVLATANTDKAAEISEIVAAAAGEVIELVPRPEEADEVEETGDTLEENARLKARALVALCGMPAVADDTGLEVDALGGAPGVRSSRYAGLSASYDENVAKLLGALKEAGAREDDERRARFRTVAIACFPDGRELLAQGVVEGTIARDRRGGRGFGYDPVFVPAGHELTFAEMEPQDKHSLSHRGRAFRALAAMICAETSA
jgi:XTP/dITP diphosphohydrolase